MIKMLYREICMVPKIKPFQNYKIIRDTTKHIKYKSGIYLMCYFQYNLQNKNYLTKYYL